MKKVSSNKGCWVGVDGTRTGWVAFVWKDDGDHQLWHINKLSELESLSSRHNVEVIALDMPIGLLEVAQKGGRGCDREARRLLSSAKRNAIKRNSSSRQLSIPFVGPSSIFTPPCRKAMRVAFHDNKSTIVCCTHAQVSAANKESVIGVEGSDTTGDGLGLSIQTFHILPKIKEADDLVSAATLSDSKAQAVALESAVPILECHPELAFLALALNSDTDVSLEKAKALYSKKVIQGRRQRLEVLCKKGRLDASQLLLLAGAGIKGPASEGNPLDQLSQLRTWRIASLSGQSDDMISVAADDVFDAIVCAGTGRRWSLGQARAVSEDGGTIIDDRSLPMVIWA